jgi:GNAT superfamily N-acetyltransferase
MTSNAPPVDLSPIDGERFGISVARASLVAPDTLPSVNDFCHEKGVALLVARCPASELRTAQAMERDGYSLMDTLSYYARNLTKMPIPPDTGTVLIRPVRPGEDEAVKRVAAESFRGYLGHYHADERLGRKECDEVYTSWAVRSCISRDVANEVLVADIDGDIVGFAALRLNSPEEGEGVLFGVAPSAQGRGIYRSLMIRGMEWCRSKGATRMVISTQITNVAVQKVWVRVGCEPSHAYYTFHKWFDRS